MVAIARLPNLITRLPTSLPTIGGIAAGVLVAALIVLLPAATLEQLVWSSGVASLLAAARPPLGMTARALLALGGGMGIGAIVWSVLFLLFGPGGFVEMRGRPGIGIAHRRPGVRRADAHPDAPPRRPMTAADLGTPLMEVAPTPRPVAPAMQSLPVDLDQPLAAFDPGALPASPREPVRPVAALAPGERIETFALAPPPPSAAPVRREPASAQTIDALLRRLEEGAARRPPARRVSAA